MKNIIKKICFDFDGVLIDSFDQGSEQTQMIAQALGVRVPSKEEIGRQWGVVFPKYVEALMPGITTDQFIEKHYELGFDKVCCPAISGARETIKWLKERFLLSVISNREGDSFPKLFSGAGYDSQDFSYVQTSSDTEFHKPDPRVFEKVWQLAAGNGLREENLLYVGDTLVDYQSTVDTGMQFVAVLSGTGTKEDFLQVGVAEQRIIPSIQYLPELLK